MAEFTADTSQMEALAQQIKTLSARTDDLASRVHSTGQRISGIKSLKDKGFVSKVDSATKGLRNSADEVGTVSSRITKAASAYAQCETSVKAKMDATVIGAASVASAGAVAGTAAAGGADKKSGKKSSKSGKMSSKSTSLLKRALDILGRNIDDTKKAIKDFRKWRATKGSEIVESIYDMFSDEPGLQTVIKDVVDKYNGKITRYEDMLTAVLHPENNAALVTGAVAFGDETKSGLGTAVKDIFTALGNPSDTDGAKEAIFSALNLVVDGVGDTARRFDKLQQQYMDRGVQKAVNGDIVGGVVTALGGGLLAFGDMAVDVSVKTLNSVFRKEIPLLDKVIKARDTTYTLVYNQSTSDMINSTLGKIGSGIRSFFDKVTA